MMSSKSWVAIIGILGALVLLTVACTSGFVVGRFLFPASVAVDSESPLLDLPTAVANDTEIFGQGNAPADLDELFQPFWQTWELVHENYVDQPVDDEVLMRGAISGMLEALGDQHTSYLDPEQFQESNAQLQGQEYEGIGAWVDISGDYLTIISPMPGSPAEKAGLRPDDKVVGVDGVDVTGLDGESVRQRVIGPRGSTVTLTIQREGQENFDVVVERANIVVPTVDSEMLEEQVAYIRLYTFGDDTSRDLRKAINELIGQNPKGMILDLRNNGGGYLETAIDVASEFIPDGVIMYEEYGDGSREIYEARRGGKATDIPLVVLINEGSASASEIVAGAIQDRDRGILVGETSYGKGSVQTYNALVNDQGAVRVTIARWLTPNQRQINEIGLEPDVMIEISEENITAEVDPQLEEAIRLLLP
jgi:carboxyl-terminal processing protease